MPYDPTEILGEVLGRPAQKGFNPASQNFQCPFIDAKCVKRSTSLKNEPYPVCSIRRNTDNVSRQICVCPKRFYGVDFIRDVVDNCWPEASLPKQPKVAREVKMTGFGNVDFVIADLDNEDDEEVGQFLSVELQAIDITGSVMKAYQAMLAGEDLEKRPSYGLNWANVYKRYITQLIRKGYFHHHWGSKIVAVMQDAVYKYIKEWAEFMCSPDVRDDTVNIIFMTYRYEDDLDSPGEQRLVLDQVEGTSHANLQQAILYKEPPSRVEFCEKIKASLARND